GEPLPWGHLASHYTFVGASDKDYGMLHCWANNSIGVQDNPCIFQIIPAGPPSSPENCEIINNTAENIEVLCERGFDGGMPQLFLAEVYDEPGSLHLNRSSEEPQFSVEPLQPGTTYTIRISAFNDKGRSPPVSLTAVTLKVAEQRVGENKSLLYSPLIIIFLSIVGVFLTLILILIIVTRWRKSYSSTSTSSSTAAVAPSTDPAQEEPAEDRNRKEETQPQKTKPKKKVVVIENGTKDKIGLGDVSVDVTSSKDALLGRHTDLQTLANGSAGYYNSLGKTSFPSTVPSSSSCTLPRSQRTSTAPATTSSSSYSPSGALPINHSSLTAANNAATAAAAAISLAGESYTPYARYSETLPRNYGRGTRDFDGYHSEAYRGGGDGSLIASGGYRRSNSGNLGPDSYRGSITFASESYLSDEGSILSDGYRSVVGGQGRGGGGGGGRMLGDSYRCGGGVGGSSGANTEHDTYQVGGSVDCGEPYRVSGSVGVVETTYRTGAVDSSSSGGGGGGCRGRSGKDKYHLLEDLKNNPKYVVRTRGGETSDESFV
ncbi:hypothetical protein OTU49_008078, partial [Cherax quadricarinatus]